MNKLISDIESQIRESMARVFKDNRFLNERKVKRTDYLSDLVNLDTFLLNQINWHQGYLLNPSIYPSRSGSDIVRFGKRIKDWTNLLAWRDGVIEFKQIVPGFKFYNNNRTFELESVKGIEDNVYWILRYSVTHSVGIEPKKLQKKFNITFNNIPDKERFEYLFARINR